MNNEQLHDWLADLHERFCPDRRRLQQSEADSCAGVDGDGSSVVVPPSLFSPEMGFDDSCLTTATPTTTVRAPPALCSSPESPTQWRPLLSQLSPSSNILLHYFNCNFEDTRLSSPLVAQLLALYYKFGAARCFVLQLVPTFIYLYLKALNKRWMNAAQMLETLFLAIYNEEILAAGPGTPSMAKRSEEVLLPLLRSASVVPSTDFASGTGSSGVKVSICPQSETASVNWRSGVGGGTAAGGSQSKLLTAGGAATAGTSCSSGRGGTLRSKRASTVRLGPYPAIDSMLAENRFTVLTRLMRVVSHLISHMAPEVVCPALCRSLLYICRSGFSFQESDLRQRVLRERASAEVFADFSKKARIRVVPQFLVESINGVNFALLNGHADIALRTLDAIHQRARYEMMADVLLETNALRHALLDPKTMQMIVLKGTPLVEEQQQQQHTNENGTDCSVSSDTVPSSRHNKSLIRSSGANSANRKRDSGRRTTDVPMIAFSDCST